jgi:hypothetical protein
MKVIDWGPKHYKEDWGRAPRQFRGAHSCPKCDGSFRIGFFDDVIRRYNQPATKVVSIWIQCPICSEHLIVMPGQRRALRYAD